MTSLDNANPEVFQASTERATTEQELDDEVEDPIDSREIFDILRSEHPDYSSSSVLSLELFSVGEMCTTILFAKGGYFIF